MKNIFYLFLLVFNILSAQSGIVKYNFYGPNYDKTITIDETDAYLNQILNYANKQEFELNFNKLKSSFKYINRMNYEANFNEKVENIAKSLYTSKDFYTNFEEKFEIIVQNGGVLVRTEINPLKWEIMQDSKKIGNYLCYKAILKTPFVNKLGETKIKESVAWFAPTLPYSYGPKNFHGLPGLILELSENQKTFIASKVELLDKEVKIDFPKGKTVPKDEYEKRLKENMGAVIKR